MSNMEAKKATPKSRLQTMTILHAATVMPIVIFLGVAYFLTDQEDFSDDSDLSKMLLIFVPIIAIIGFTIGTFIFRKQLVKIRKLEHLKDKQLQYQTISIMQYALLEGPGLFAAVAYFMTGDLIFAGIAVVIIVLLLMNRPTKFKIVSDLELSQADKTLLD